MCLSTQLCLSYQPKEGCEAIGAPLCSKSCASNLSHHLPTICRRFVTGGRSSSGVPSIDAVPYKVEESTGRCAGSDLFHPSLQFQPSPASLCFGLAQIWGLLSHSLLWPSFFFLFIPLPELFKHPHLDIYMSGAIPLPLFPKSIIYHHSGPCAPTLPFY